MHKVLTLVLLILDLPYFENSVDPDQLASDKDSAIYKRRYYGCIT